MVDDSNLASVPDKFAARPLPAPRAAGPVAGGAAEEANELPGKWTEAWPACLMSNGISGWPMALRGGATTGGLRSTDLPGTTTLLSSVSFDEPGIASTGLGTFARRFFLLLEGRALFFPGPSRQCPRVIVPTPDQ